MLEPNDEGGEYKVPLISILLLSNEVLHPLGSHYLYFLVGIMHPMRQRRWQGVFTDWHHLLGVISGPCQFFTLVRVETAEEVLAAAGGLRRARLGGGEDGGHDECQRMEKTD